MNGPYTGDKLSQLSMQQIYLMTIGGRLKPE